MTLIRILYLLSLRVIIITITKQCTTDNFVLSFYRASAGRDALLLTQGFKSGGYQCQILYKNPHGKCLFALKQMTFFL